MQGYTSNPPQTMRGLDYASAARADLAARLSPAGFLDDQPAALQVARWAYRQAAATSAQLWVSLKYTVNADRSCLEILST